MVLVQPRKTIPRTLVRWLPLLLVFLTIAGIVVLLGRNVGSVGASGGAIAIDGGHDHTCAVLEDGGVQCWGSNTSGQLGDGTLDSSATPVDVCAAGSGPACAGGSRLEGIVDVAAGFAHTCALTDEGGVLCWGAGDAGQLGDGTTNSHSNPASVCVSGSGVGCSGGSTLTGVAAIDVGSEFSCALMFDTGIKCWGSDEDGQLGIGTMPPMAGQVAGGFGGFEALPQDVCGFTLVLFSFGQPAGIVPCLPLEGFTSVAAGGAHACGLLDSTGIKCWGAGPLGDGTTNTTGIPVDVCSDQFIIIPFSGEQAGISCAPLGGFTDVQAGLRHTCALTEAGGVMCWGQNGAGEIGDGTPNDRTTPVDVCASGSGSGCGGGAMLAGITAITAGSEYTCAVAAAGDARCWGSLLGDGTNDDSENPVGVLGLTSGVTAIAGGAQANHACAARDDGSLFCWGENSSGQLGIGSASVASHPAPEQVGGFAPKITPTPTASDTPTSTPAVPTDTPGPGTPEPTATPAPNGLIGDVNCDGEINAIDAAFILQFIAGLIDELPCPENADVNEDGATNTIDAALILQFSAGLLGMLPP